MAFKITIDQYSRVSHEICLILYYSLTDIIEIVWTVWVTVCNLFWMWWLFRKFIIIYLRQCLWGRLNLLTIGRHYTKTLTALILQEIDFFTKKNKKSSPTTSSPSKIHFCVFFIFTINYFRSWGSIKKFITNKDKFIAEKILGVGRESLSPK